VGQAIGTLCQKEDMPADEAMVVIYGGAGPLHGCNIAKAAVVHKIVITPFSAVFSAFSSSLIDVGHVYHTLAQLPLSDATDFKALHASVMAMRKRAIQDMRGEGYQEGALQWAMELVVQHDSTHREERLLLALEGFDQPLNIRALRDEAIAKFGADPSDSLTLVSVGLQVFEQIAHFEQPRHPKASVNPSEAIVTKRAVCFTAGEPTQQIAVYDHAKLDHGHSLSGPAIVESDQTTVLVNDGWTLRVDEYRNAILHDEEGAA